MARSRPVRVRTSPFVGHAGDVFLPLPPGPELTYRLTAALMDEGYADLVDLVERPRQRRARLLALDKCKVDVLLRALDVYDGLAPWPAGRAVMLLAGLMTRRGVDVSIEVAYDLVVSRPELAAALGLEGKDN